MPPLRTTSPYCPPGCRSARLTWVKAGHGPRGGLSPSPPPINGTSRLIKVPFVTTDPFGEAQCTHQRKLSTTTKWLRSPSGRTRVGPRSKTPGIAIARQPLISPARRSKESG